METPTSFRYIAFTKMFAILLVTAYVRTIDILFDV